MRRFFQLIAIVALATIFSCSNTKTEKEKDEQEESANPVANADKIVYNQNGPTVAPKYNRGATITITPSEMLVEVKSYSDVLSSKRYPFNKEKFAKLLQSFEDLKKTEEPKDDEIPVGGGSKSITFYKNGKVIFEGYDYGGAKNFSGAKIDLAYLVPDLNNLIESTKNVSDE